MPETAYDEVYQNGVRVSRTPRTVSDTELDRLSDSNQIRQAQATLRQWAQDAEAISNAGGTPTAAQLRQLFNRFGLLCRLQIRIIRRLGEDDGL